MRVLTLEEMALVAGGGKSKCASGKGGKGKGGKGKGGKGGKCGKVKSKRKCSTGGGSGPGDGRY